MRIGAWLIPVALLVMVANPAWGCTVSASGHAFGAYNPFDLVPAETTSEITVNCPSPYIVKIDAGFSGSFDPRAMGRDGNPADHLQYNLYTAPNFSVVWGDGGSGTGTLSGPGGSETDLHIIHGRVPARQNAQVGSYSDVLIVTLEF
jgi:spore coat protein U-like protein